MGTLRGHKAIPPFFHLALNAFPDVGSVGRIEKKKKKKETLVPQDNVES